MKKNSGFSPVYMGISPPTIYMGCGTQKNSGLFSIYMVCKTPPLDQSGASLPLEPSPRTDQEPAFLGSFSLNQSEASVFLFVRKKILINYFEVKYCEIHSILKLKSPGLHISSYFLQISSYFFIIPAYFFIISSYSFIIPS